MPSDGEFLAYLCRKRKALYGKAMRLAIIASALLLTACAPRLSFSNEAGGVINRTGSIGSDRAYKLATDHCAKYGKIARFTDRDVLTNSMRFECVAS